MFHFRLALALGMTVRQMLATIDSAELTQWKAYYALEPFGELMADQRLAHLSSLIANVNRNPEKRPEAYAPRDFFPPWMHWRKKPDTAVLLKDAEAQSALVKKTLFGGILRMGKKK